MPIAYVYSYSTVQLQLHTRVVFCMWYHALSQAVPSAQLSGDFKTHEWEMPCTRVRVTENNHGTMRVGN